MKNNKKIFIQLFLLVSLVTFNPATAQPPAVDEQRFVSIGGIEQWITIRGEDKNNPVVLFIHGGPGSVMSPYAQAIFGEWEKDFVLVNWDQRGAGKTFGRNAPADVNEEYWIENPMTLDQMINDGIELTRYLLDYLDKEKIILTGTSWGSILGAKMALAHPELYHAYLGHAQFVSFSENLEFAYDQVTKLARKAEDSSSVKQLASIGRPPYKDARKVGQLLRIVKYYESQHAAPAPDAWWIPASAYDNEEDTNNRFNGDDYSFLYFAGHEKLGIQPMASETDFRKDGLVFEIPVYFIQGEYDVLSAREINKPYFDKISAPEKEYYLLPDAGHGFNPSVVDKLYQVLKERFVY